MDQPGKSEIYCSKTWRSVSYIATPKIDQYLIKAAHSAIEGQDPKAHSARGTIKIKLSPYLRTGFAGALATHVKENLQLAEKATKGRAITLGVGYVVQKVS